MNCLSISLSHVNKSGVKFKTRSFFFSPIGSPVVFIPSMEWFWRLCSPLSDHVQVCNLESPPPPKYILNLTLTTAHSVRIRHPPTYSLNLILTPAHFCPYQTSSHIEPISNLNPSPFCPYYRASHMNPSPFGPCHIELSIYSLNLTLTPALSVCTTELPAYNLNITLVPALSVRSIEGSMLGSKSRPHSNVPTSFRFDRHLVPTVYILLECMMIWVWFQTQIVFSS